MRLGLYLSGVVAVLALCTGCGRIADPDLIKVATIDGKGITRGDLNKLIWNMPDDQRPNIRRKGDLLRVLDRHIDDLLTIPLGRQLAEEKKISVSRDAARERYFRSLGDRADQQRGIWNMEPPPPGQTTELMRVYGLTSESMRAQKDYIDQETDHVVEQLQAEEGLQYAAVEALKKGELKISDEALQREYKLNKTSLQKMETLVFRAIRFAATDPAAIVKATAVRKRVDAGEDFEKLVDEYLKAEPGSVIESEIENNPDAERFQSFWQQASGAAANAIVGPVYLPAYQQMKQDEKGQIIPKIVPEAFMVLKVLERKDARDLTFEEAKLILMAKALVGEMMKKLRADHKVEVYADKLPDPQLYADPASDPLLQ